MTSDLVDSDGLARTLRQRHSRAPRSRRPIVHFTTCGPRLSADVDFDAWAALGARTGADDKRVRVVPGGLAGIRRTRWLSRAANTAADPDLGPGQCLT